MNKKELIVKLNELQIKPNNIPSQSFYNAVEIALKLAEQLDEPNKEPCVKCKGGFISCNNWFVNFSRKTNDVDIVKYCPNCGRNLKEEL